MDKKKNDDELLDKKYFKSGNFRKIRKKLLKDIVYARVEEILDIIYKFNVNLKYLKKDCNDIYVLIGDNKIKTNFEEIFRTYFIKSRGIKVNFIDNFDTELLISNAVNLSTFGWKKRQYQLPKQKTLLLQGFLSQYLVSTLFFSETLVVLIFIN